MIVSPSHGIQHKNNSPKMRTLIPNFNHLNPNFFFKTPSIIPKFNTKPTFYLPRIPQKPNFRTSCTSPKSDASYNGWDDLRISVDSAELGESNYVKKILIYLGIDDKKYLFTSLLGFVIALAISRVRVSSIVVFPAVVIVFGVGFSIGFVNGGNRNGFGLNGGKNREKGDSLGFNDEKLKKLGEIFDGFDFKIGELKRVLRNCVDNESVELNELESYVSELASIGGLVLDARNVIEDCRIESRPKNGRNKKGIGSNGFDLLGVLGSFVRDYGSDWKDRKRNVLRRENVVKGVDNRGEKDSVSSLNGSARSGSSSNGGKRNDLDERIQVERILQSDARGYGVEQAFDSVNDGACDVISSNGGNRSELDERNLSGKMSEMEGRVDDVNGWFDYRSASFVDSQRFSFNVSSHREVRNWSVDDSMSSFTEFGLTEEYWENENSWSRQQNIEFGSYKENFAQERMNVEDELHTKKYQPRIENTTVSDDLLFNNYLTKANDLLKQAKECLKVGNEEMFAEKMLHESATLLSQAVTMKPMSLLAIGQLGNTYLLHGELKLRNSRALRNRLSRNRSFGRESQRDFLSSVSEALPNTDSNHRTATLLGQTCEECEQLLVEAGRKYRTALSIDGNDLRALYNWGLALSFRAQLIADIGPEAALDADKLFLAAIDKFDAMMSRSNVYAPEALFRWGMALQQRSRLRPSSSRDKVKLLQQAKRLYKDALDMGSNNLQVRDALSSCMSELNYKDI